MTEGLSSFTSASIPEIPLDKTDCSLHNCTQGVQAGPFVDAAVRNHERFFTWQSGVCSCP